MTVSTILFWSLCAFSAVCSCALAVFIAAWIRQGRFIASQKAELAAQRAELSRVKGVLDLTKQRSRKLPNLHPLRPRVVK